MNVVSNKLAINWIYSYKAIIKKMLGLLILLNRIVNLGLIAYNIKLIQLKKVIK